VMKNEKKKITVSAIKVKKRKKRDKGSTRRLAGRDHQKGGNGGSAMGQG